MAKFMYALVIDTAGGTDVSLHATHDEAWSKLQGHVASEQQRWNEDPNLSPEDYFSERDDWYTLEELPIPRGVSSPFIAQMGDLMEQIHQMKGMFSDDDGRIQEALDDAEEMIAEYS